MVGQENLITKLKTYSIATLPHSILFIGDKGCGKHTLVKELSDYYHVDTLDITDKLSLELIQSIYLSPKMYFYIIDANNISERDQNVILKFLEEPDKNSHIFILSTTRSILLETIINRCVIFEFEKYSKSELLQFVPFDLGSDKLLDYCVTPGQILETNVEQLDSLIEYCDNIIKNIRRAKFSNIFNIPAKLNTKDEKEKFDVYLFYCVLLKRLLLTYEQENDIILSEMYQEVLDSFKKFNTSRYNKETLLENLVIKLWKVCR